VCGSGGEGSLRFDIPRDANAFVKVVDHLESQGYHVTSDSPPEDSIQHVTFEREGIRGSAAIADSPRGNFSFVVVRSR
jgi:hypothetical protein